MRPIYALKSVFVFDFCLKEQSIFCGRNRKRYWRASEMGFGSAYASKNGARDCRIVVSAARNLICPFGHVFVVTQIDSFREHSPRHLSRSSI